MPWTYIQSTGVFQDPQGNTAATGYSGAGAGRNNSLMEREPNVGPIPRGTYRIGNARQSHRTGAVSMDLAPIASTQTFGRSAFLIHGDNLSHTASHGCIILPRLTREQINRSTDRELVVQ
ncbi:tlde1 domain-containing protein [Paraburkholderia fungorum]|uniref:tlde1 domain-containing protein n=1 Tax=Paraburkholderia fungorum TaxID=134537 RepID=UPI0038B6DE4F